MKIVETDNSDHELITTNKILWKYDQYPKNGYGWPLPVLFDRTSNIYRVMNFPGKGMQVEFDQIPSDGDHEFESLEPVQYARDIHLTTHYYRIK